MKARLANYSGFEEWLRKRKVQMGDGRKMLSQQHREESAEIYDAFLQAKSHAELMQEVDVFFKQIIKEVQ